MKSTKKLIPIHFNIKKELIKQKARIKKKIQKEYESCVQNTIQLSAPAHTP